MIVIVLVIILVIIVISFDQEREGHPKTVDRRRIREREPDRVVCDCCTAAQGVTEGKL